MTAEEDVFKLKANRILVVEDDKDIREGVEIYLRNQGYGFPGRGTEKGFTGHYAGSRIHLP